MQRTITVLLILSAGSLAAIWPQPSARLNERPVTFFTAQSADGNWEGTLSAGGNNLRLVLKIAGGPGGALKAAVDSLDQGALDLKVDLITFKDGALHFEM